VPPGHVPHDVSAHAPLAMSHESGAAHVTPPHEPHPGTQTPSTHTCPPAHDTPAQRSTHALPTHDCPCGHTTPSHGVPQPPAVQIWPAGHVTPMHFGSTQRPDAESHVPPPWQGNSTLPQCGTHLPSSQT
jgi:hypothetical protein